jgi:hypothetical protein
LINQHDRFHGSGVPRRKRGDQTLIYYSPGFDDTAHSFVEKGTSWTHQSQKKALEKAAERMKRGEHGRRTEETR